MEEKKPLETKITKNIEVELSFGIQIQRQKNILNLIWHWHVTAPPIFPPVREFIFIPSVHEWYCFDLMQTLEIFYQQSYYDRSFITFSKNELH